MAHSTDVGDITAIIQSHHTLMQSSIPNLRLDNTSDVNKCSSNIGSAIGTNFLLTTTSTLNDGVMTGPAVYDYKFLGQGRSLVHCLALLFIYKVVPKKAAFTRMRRYNDQQTIKTLDKLLAIKVRAAKLSEKRIGLQHCIENDIFPAAIMEKLRYPSSKAAKKLLYNKVSSIDEQLLQSVSQVTTFFPTLCALNMYSYLIFMKYCAHLCCKARNAARAKVHSSITYPLSYMPTENTINNVRNLSSYQLSNIEIEALSMGIKFCIPPRFNKRYCTQMKAQFELLYNQTTGLTCRSGVNDSLLRSRLVVLCNELCKKRFSSTLCPLTGTHLNALNNLVKNKELFISQPDKGDGIVVLNRDDYVNKMLDILNDRRRFKVDPKQEDLTDQILKKVKKAVKDVADKGFITTDCADRLVPTGYTIPRLYGLPKIHKPNVPVRPILSMVGSPQHILAKYLANILKPIESYFCKHQIIDSFELVQKLKNINLQQKDGVFLGSLDVTSLFTSVPVKKCIKIIADVVDSGSVDFNMDGSSLTQLLNVCVQNVQFLCNGVYYTQIDGVAMGSPLGPVLANIYVGYVESLMQKSDSDIFFYGRYVDDILVIAKDSSAINSLNESLNSVDCDIQFTCEYEVDGSLPFLDVRIHRDNNSLKFSWYHKTTWTGSLLRFNSFVPLSWKTGLLKGFKIRLLRICSPQFLDKALDEMESAFLANGYPESLIQTCFRYFLPNETIKKVSTASRKPLFVYLPFLGDSLSLQVTARLGHYFRCAYPASRVCIRWTTCRAFHPKLKDKLPILNTPNVVYHFKCVCDSAEYVGRTQLPLSVRIRQHVPKWLIEGKKQRPRSDRAPDSSIARHRLICNHRDDHIYSRFKILHVTNNFMALKVLEALEIKNKNPSLCIQKDRLFELKIPWF